MNVFFIFPSIQDQKTVNHGVTSLCGIIKARGHHVDLYHPDKLHIKKLHKEFRKKHYGLILISTVTNQWPYALQMIKALKTISGAPLIVGGHHVTNNPNTLEETAELDGICIGEGDLALGALLDKLDAGEDYHHTENMWFRNRGDSRIIRNPLGRLVENLDSLPMPDYSVYARRAVLNYPNLMFSRGCPYNCTYCCNNYLKELFRGKGKYVRHKSPERAMKEVKMYITTYNPGIINFDDDLFVANRKWLYPFLDLYKEFSTVPFRCNTRPETVRDDVCQKLKEANCEGLSIGLESGNAAIREHTLKRRMPDATIRQAFSLAKKYGLKTNAFNLVGLPGETWENYLETVQLNADIQPDTMQMAIFYPYKGTELGNRAYAEGLVDEKDFNYDYFSKSILKMKQFPRWKIRIAQKFFQFHVIRKRSLVKATRYFLRYNFITNAYIRKYVKILLNK